MQRCRLNAAGCVIGLRELLSTQRAYHAAVSPPAMTATASSVTGATRGCSLERGRAYHGAQRGGCAAVSPGLLEAAAWSVSGRTTARSGAAVQLRHRGC
eukprot:scaffold10113_cov48-Phaeocystis_antarctica.AAC.1